MGLNNAYGIDANSLGEPYSLFASILLILGFAQLGMLLEKFLAPSKCCNDKTQFYSLQKIAIAPIYGASFLGAILFPLTLFGSYARQLLFSVALLLCMLGIYFGQSLIRFGIFSRSNHTANNVKFRLTSIPYIFCFFFLLGYALLASSPPTDADDLDYHSGVALALLNQGSWPFAPEWFHSRLAGLGECLVALGYAIGANQFGSLLQFCGLTCISSLLIWPKGNRISKSSAWMALLFLSSPVLLWLTSTSKPLLFPIAMTTLALWHLIQPLRHSHLSRRELLLHFSIAIFLATLASQMKFNFLLSGFLVGVIAIYVMYLFNLLRFAVPIAAIIFGFTMIPFSLWKKIHYGGNWVSNLYTLFPGNWPGYSSFEAYLRNYEESSFSFPISLIISPPNQVTNLIGLGVIAWFIALIWLLSKWPTLSTETKILYSASVTLVLMGTFLGQHGGRFYLEPLVWMLLALINFKTLPNIFTSRIGPITLCLQSSITAFGLIVCIWILLPGSLNDSIYQSIMHKRAYQYPEMKILEESLPKDAVLLTNSRSIALSSRPVLSASGWPNYVLQDESDPSPYLEIIRKSGVNYLQTNQPIDQNPWKDCINSEPLFITNSHHNSRNPINSGTPYRVWIYSFDSSKLPDCFRTLK